MSFLQGQNLAAILGFVAVFLGVVSLVLAAEIIRGWWVQRKIRGRLTTKKVPAGQSSVVLFDVDPAGGGPLGATLGRAAEALGVGPLLRQSKSTLSVPGFFGVSAGLFVGVLLAVSVLGFNVFMRAPLALVAASVPYAVLAVKRKLRLRAFETNLPGAVDLLARAIRAGHPLSSGIRMVAEEASEPVASEFRTLFEEQRFGIPFDEALGGLMDRVDLVDVRILVTAILVQREVGGNLAEVLDNISKTMRQRFSIRRQLRVYTAQGRLSGYVLAVMPFVVGAALYALDQEYMGALFFTPLGRFLLICAFSLWIIGFLWIRKIVNIEI